MLLFPSGEKVSFVVLWAKCQVVLLNREPSISCLGGKKASQLIGLCLLALDQQNHFLPRNSSGLSQFTGQRGAWKRR